MKSVRCLIVFAALFTAAAAVYAQDPLKVNPKTVSFRFENDRVRVLEARLAPGDKEQLHSHPPSIIYVISGGKVRNHSADGKTAESVMATGDVVYRDALTHWAENIGTTEIHLILVELKSSQPSTASSVSQTVDVSHQFYKHTGVDNDRVRVLEYHIKPGQHEPLHSHLAEIAYVISGGTLRTTDAKGPHIGTLKAGEVHWRDHVVHSVENVGDTELRALIVELKEQKTALALK